MRYGLAAIFLINSSLTKFLEQGDMRIFVYIQLFFPGWGRTVGGGPSAIRLQQAKMPVVKNSVCNLKNENKITPGMLCAGIPEGSIVSGCHGDSGGPFVCKNKKDNRWVSISITITYITEKSV